VPTQAPKQIYRGSIPEVKRPTFDLHPSPPSSPEVKGECSYNSTLPSVTVMIFHGVTPS